MDQKIFTFSRSRFSSMLYTVIVIYRYCVFRYIPELQVHTCIHKICVCTQIFAFNCCCCIQLLGRYKGIAPEKHNNTYAVNCVFLTTKKNLCKTHTAVPHKLKFLKMIMSESKFFFNYGRPVDSGPLPFFGW